MLNLMESKGATHSHAALSAALPHACGQPLPLPSCSLPQHLPSPTPTPSLPPSTPRPQARPRCLTRGQSALVEVTSSRGLVLEEYAHYRALGRVALREGGRTLAVGVVTQLLE